MRSIQLPPWNFSWPPLPRQDTGYPHNTHTGAPAGNDLGELFSYRQGGWLDDLIVPTRWFNEAKETGVLSPMSLIKSRLQWDIPRLHPPFKNNFVSRSGGLTKSSSSWFCAQATRGPDSSFFSTLQSLITCFRWKRKFQTFYFIFIFLPLPSKQDKHTRHTTHRCILTQHLWTF